MTFFIERCVMLLLLACLGSLLSSITVVILLLLNRNKGDKDKTFHVSEIFVYLIPTNIIFVACVIFFLRSYWNI